MNVRAGVSSALLTLVLPLAACSTGSGSDAKPQVVASFYPLAFVTERVAGDYADVISLTQPGQEPHDLELSPVQVGRVETADLVVYESGLQASVDGAVDQASDVLTVDATEVVDLAPSDQSLEPSDDLAPPSQDHSEPDPHFWLDPERMALLAQEVADNMARIDPDNAAHYRSNAAALVAELSDLDRELSIGLADCALTDVVVSHDAFGYLAKYGLTFHGIASLSPDAEPTPGDLAELADLISATSITTVFSERLVSASLAQTLASEMGIATAVLDPIEGLTDETAEEDYFSLMRQNLAALQEANQCQ